MWCVLLTASYTDKESDQICTKYMKVILDLVCCVSQKHVCLQIFDAVSDGDQMKVWMPAKKDLKLGTDGRWLSKWKFGNVTEPQMTFPISPLSVDKEGKIRIVTGVSGTSDLVCDLVKESVLQWSDMEKFRKYFVVVSERKFSSFHL